MKTKTILFGVVVAALSAISLGKANAQAPAEPAVKVIPVSKEKDVLKVIYGYSASKAVEVKFFGSDGIIESDKINGSTFESGFMKKYNVKGLRGELFSIEISSPEVSVTYKVSMAKDGRWSTQLEKTTYNFPLLASN
jgi:hypothetical protein